MPYLLPAVRGRMGSTEYFQANLAARDLAGMAMLASELPAWSEWSIFERFQRDLADARVSKEIVPYLARTRDRFFGALIVLVYEPETFEFEPLDQLGLKLGKAYKKVADQMGFLAIDGGDLVVLDGQHRLAALRELVTSGDEVQGDYKDEVAEDELCVIFIKHESFEKTRRIFNKVNRYAKPTSPSDNIITSEDDGYAIVARWLVEPAPPLGLDEPMPPLNLPGVAGEPIVEWRSTQLTQYSSKLTTLTAVYQTTQIILNAKGITKFSERDRVNRPSDVELATAYRHAARWWTMLLDGFEPFKIALANPSQIRDLRQYREPWSLAFRPVAQVSMFLGLATVVGLGLSFEEAVDRSNAIDWCASSDMWVDTVIHANGKMSTRQEGIKLAGRLISYLISPEKFTTLDKEKLCDDLRRAKGSDTFSLPAV